MRIKLVLILLVLCSYLSANPFLGETEGPSPVRAPSSQAPQKLIETQLEFREKVGDLLSQWNEEDSLVGKIVLILPILGLAFLYGVFHALGPGHRKTVIFSLFLSRKTKPLEPLMAGFLSSFLHGLSGMILILIFRSLSARFLIQEVEKTSLYLEGFTFVALALIATFLLIHEAIQLKRNQEERSLKRKDIYSTITLTSLFPCPVAIMILVFTLTMDMLLIGFFAVIALSLGMGVIVSAVAYLARAGRESILVWFDKKKKIILVAKLLEMGSYLFLILFSLWMALPFLGNWI